MIKTYAKALEFDRRFTPSNQELARRAVHKIPPTLAEFNAEDAKSLRAAARLARSVIRELEGGPAY